MTREEAINDLKDFIDTYLTVHGEEDTIAVSLDNVDVEAFDIAIKALEKEPRKGHWIMTGDYLTTAYGSVDYVKCSCCGEDSLEEGDYCPNCGAKMESEEKK